MRSRLANKMVRIETIEHIESIAFVIPQQSLVISSKPLRVWDYPQRGCQRGRFVLTPTAELWGKGT